MPTSSSHSASDITNTTDTTSPTESASPATNESAAPRGKRARQYARQRARQRAASAAEATAREIADEVTAAPTAEQRKALRDNARRVLRESGAAEILQTLNKHALQGRGHFEEYDSGVIFKWGTGYTRRHIWVDVCGDQLRFRLRPHLKCTTKIPACDGEYHSFTAETWRIPNAVLREVDRNYKHPVAETSDD